MDGSNYVIVKETPNPSSSEEMAADEVPGDLTNLDSLLTNLCVPPALAMGPEKRNRKTLDCTQKQETSSKTAAKLQQNCLKESEKYIKIQDH